MKNVPFELTRAHISEPGWMPGHKEIRTVLDNWAAFTDEERETMSKRLTKIDARAAKIALLQLTILDEKSRCELVRPILKAAFHVMNFLNSPVASSDVLQQCSNLMADKNPRVRKSVAQAVGSSWSELKAQDRELLVLSLIDALRNVSESSEKKALVDALGKSGHPMALKTLQAVDQVDSKAIIQLNRDLAPRSQDGDLCLPEKFSGTTAFVLWVMPGLDRLVEELPIANKLRRYQPGVFISSSLSWTEVNSVYLWDKIGLHLGESKHHDPTDLARRLAEHSVAISQATDRSGDSPVRVRLGRGEGVTRSFVWEFAEELQKLQLGIINDGRDAHWDLALEDNMVVLVPQKMPLDKLLWRNSNVDGASSIAIASAIVQLAAIKPGEIVYDPFCGAGTELILGFHAMPEAHFVGSDIDESAIEAARRASQIAAAKIEYKHQDALSFTGGPFDVVLTNPPFGMRTVRGGARQVLEGFLCAIGQKLTPLGRVVMLSHAPSSTRDWAKVGGLRLARAVPVSLGRMPCELQVFARKT